MTLTVPSMKALLLAFEEPSESSESSDRALTVSGSGSPLSSAILGWNRLNLKVFSTFAKSSSADISVTNSGAFGRDAICSIISFSQSSEKTITIHLISFSH